MSEVIEVRKSNRSRQIAPNCWEPWEKSAADLINPIPQKRAYNFKDISGRTFGKLSVVGYHGKRNGSTGHTRWVVRCDCGRIGIRDTSALLTGKTSRCTGSGCGGAIAADRNGRVSYMAAHSRIRAARGNAPDYPCVRCGQVTSNNRWSYQYHTATERLIETFGAGKGCAYSSNPADYESMCTPCHKAYDRAGREERDDSKWNTPSDDTNHMAVMIAYAREVASDHGRREAHPPPFPWVPFMRYGTAKAFLEECAS